MFQIGELLQKSDKFWLRPWNWENIYSFGSHYYDYKSGINYITQINDTVIDTILSFTNYKYRDEIEELLDNKELKFYTVFHYRTDEKRLFKGVTLSIGSKVEGGWDRLDLIFEDESINGEFDETVNSVRLYYSPYHRYIERDFDMFYWDSSDSRSLEIFQNGYRDVLHFRDRDKNRDTSAFSKIFISNFRTLQD